MAYKNLKSFNMFQLLFDNRVDVDSNLTQDVFVAALHE